jgi:4-hydroxy-3-methylbut-2-enyl diphosphate reductase IspH
MAVLNPFDFFLEPEAEAFPFKYDKSLEHDLAPFQLKCPPTPLFMKFLGDVKHELLGGAGLVPDAKNQGRRTMDFLVALNQRLWRDIKYLIRLEPGVQTPEQTLAEVSGSCRDSAWLLCQLLRHLDSPRREDICYATQNRQDAVKTLVEYCDVLIVVGSHTSSNSNRLREIAEKQGIRGYLVDGAADLRREWLAGIADVGVTAGASAPEVLVQEVVATLRAWGGEPAVEVPGRAEHVVFGLPRPLRQVERQA